MVPRVPIMTVKLDCDSYDQLRMLDAWQAWGVPVAQQRAWVLALWGGGMPQWNVEVREWACESDG